MKATPGQADDHHEIDEYLDRLCFGLADPEQNRQRFPGDGLNTPRGTRLWMQVELSMHNTDLRTLKNGEGVVVAKVRNESDRVVRLAKWHHNEGSGLPRETDAYLWLGLDGNGVAYSRVFVRDRHRRMQVLSNDPTATWQIVDQKKRDKALGSWDPHEHDSLNVKTRQKPGSGWVSCLAGCCTALNAFRSPN